MVAPGAALRTCFWTDVAGSGGRNILLPDAAGTYWYSRFVLPPGGKVVLRGEYPHARSFFLEQIECGEDETVLDAAFRAGYSLAHGCREGQCSACKCYLLDGEVTLKPSSTFALSENEQLQGYTLLCRAMPDSDLDIELLHFDPDNYRLDVEISDVTATVVAVEPLTHDIVRLVLRLDGPFTFTPGQYVDLGDALGDFAFIPVLSDDDWDGETGFVHEAVVRFLAAGGLEGYEAYVCGPPPLIDATIELLDGHGVSQDHIHFDKFTTAAEAGGIPA